MAKGLEVLDNIDIAIKDLKSIKIGIVAARFNTEIIDHMISGAETHLASLGIKKSNIDIFRVPGAFELPLAAKICAESNKYDGLIAFGSVIRGDTDHYIYICNESVRGLMKVMLKFNIPVAMGVLTTDTYQQAMQRADIKQENKGAEITRSLLEMIELKNKF